MSKNNKYRNVNPEDLIRYSTGGLSDEERHALEREVQKDRFTEEALEGFSSLSTDKTLEDLSRLRSLLNRRISGRRSMVWVRIAASVAVILALGTIYITVFTDKLGKLDQTVAESESLEPAREKGVPEDLKIQDEVGIRETVVSEDLETIGEVGAEAAIVPERLDAGGGEEEKTSPAIVEESTVAEGPVKRITAEEPTAETEFSEDTKMIAVEGDKESESGVTNEVVVSDYNARLKDSFLLVGVEEMAKKELSGKSAAVVSSVRQVPDSIPALPVGGLDNFNRYIEENIRYPDGDSLPLNAAVELAFDISNTGRPEKIEIINSPGDPFSMEAVRLLQDGPAWSPAFKDGRPAARRNRLIIEFIRE